MRRWLEYVGYFVMALIGLTLVTAWYWERNQTIDFSLILPSTLHYCGREITTNDREYLVLSEWLKKNKTNWVNSLVSYVPKVTFSSPTISINVLKNIVVVNYAITNSEWNQVVQKTGKSDFLFTCEPSK